MDKYQEALDRIKNKKAIIDGEKMTIGTAYCNTFPILQELINNYAKYKRAFEILKDEFGLEIKECCDKYKKAFKKDYQITSYSHRVFVTKDVAELLEELMKSE